MEKPTFEVDLHPVQKWQRIKEYRDYLLTKTDYTQIPDNPLPAAKKAEFAEYRQVLRDIPATYPNPDNVVWPDMPSAT